MNKKEQAEILKNKLKELERKEPFSKEGKLMFYHFRQNNSGGHFEKNKNVAIHVFIEAHNAEEANELADNFGIYFDGCSMGIDCSCCGDRWHSVDEDDYCKLEKPEVTKGIDIHDEFVDMFSDECRIHYYDGHSETIKFKDWTQCKNHEWEQKYNIGKQCKICHIWQSKSKELEKKNNGA